MPKKYDYASEAREALRQKGFSVDSVEFDNTEHRCSTDDRPDKQNGSIRAELENDFPLVFYYNHRTEKGGVWFPNQKKLTDAQLADIKRRVEKDKEERDAKQAKAQEKAARKARDAYKNAKKCKSHRYLKKKGVSTVDGLKEDDAGMILMPLFDEQGKIATLQRISENRKFNFPGGKRKGCYFPIGDADEADTLLLAEGLSTGISAHESTGLPVWVTGGKGNLTPVAEIARRRYPDIKIVLAADNDIPDDEGGKNGGVECATAAAQAVDGFVAIPELEDGGACDFNELHQKEGEKRVRFFIEHAVKPAPSDVLPSGFLIRKDANAGLYHVVQVADTVIKETLLGPPLYVRGMVRDETGAGWGTLFEWTDPDCVLKRHIIPWRLMKSPNNAWFGELADQGWFGQPDGNAKMLLEKYVSAYKTEHRCLTVHRTGWVNGRFVLPDTVLGESGAEEVFYVGKTAQNPYQTSGSLQGWKESIGALSMGNSRLAFMISAALAPALLNVLNIPESFIINFVGDSSTGKTTAVAAASSVWGKGSISDGYILTWRATDNGLEGEALRHNDAALCLDEMSLADPGVVATAAYMLASGKGKSRSDTNGKAKETSSWRCIGLSSNEEGLTELLAANGKRAKAGQTVRIIDVPADAGAGMGLFEDLHEHDSPKAFADAIKEAAITNYGHAARAFIIKIQEDPEKVVRLARKYMDKKRPELGADDADSQVQRVADKFLLCAVAGRLAAQWGIVPWKKGESFNAAQACFRAWIKRRGSTGAFEDTEIEKRLLLFLEQHGSSRFQPLRGHDSEQKCINRAGFKDEQPKKTVYYILPETFKEEIYRGIDYRRAAKVLAERSLLSREKKGFTRPVDLPGLGRKRCFTIEMGTGDSREDK
ncbi:DUF927 domain-containing protein [Desulfovibrio sp. OttesenSCG-928-O18]|nr:DUF927 domain-containing protein [Desulfovibrio sp. OttesenSCG-928-O18]